MPTIFVSELTAPVGQHTVVMTAIPLPRRRLMRSGAGICVIVGAFLAAPFAHAGSHHDQDRAREALERGEALPLTDILARVRPGLGGEIVGVSFEREDGRWIYEFKVVGPDGRLKEVYVDAATALVLKQKVK